jgi:enoyl-CoA hydratase/carnithine racemase
MIEVSDDGRVRVIRLARPEVKNAMNEAMWEGLSRALRAASADRSVAVVVLTGTSDSFSAGQDLVEWTRNGADKLQPEEQAFAACADQLIAFPKPLFLAINGMAVGFGATIIGLADLVFMATDARIRCPFTNLGLAPEFGSSFTFPALIGRQNAVWALMSSEWITADQCLAMGLVYALSPPEDLFATTMAHAQTLASKPITALVECKRALNVAFEAQIYAARKAEDDASVRLLGGPAYLEAMQAFAQKRAPDFSAID